MKYLIYAVALMLFTGCGFQTKYAVSVPVLAEKSFWGNKNDYRVKLESLNIDIVPSNHTKISETAYLTFIPVYHSKKNNSPKHRDAIFKIRVALQPKRLGFSFDPQKTELDINGNITKPQKTSPYRMPEKNITVWVRKMVASGYVFCTGEIESKGNAQEIFILKNTEWYCYDLIFDAEVPSPENEFSISLPGIYIDGAMVDVTEINFKKAYSYANDSFP